MLRLIKITPVVLTVFVITFAFVTPQSQTQDIETNIVIPAINVSAPIVYAPLAGTTWDVSHLDMTVGRFEGMPWFGSNTNVVLGGHSIGTEGQPDVFYYLEYMEVGDDIYINIDARQYHFVVTEKLNVSENMVDVLYPTSHSQLTLLACDPTSFDGKNYLQRTVIIAVEVDAGQA